MRLEELIFCTLFIVLPLVGTLAKAIAHVFYRGEVVEGQACRDEEDFSRFKKHPRNIPAPAFANMRVMEYQLMENKLHIPLRFVHKKNRTNPRAGP